MTPAIQTRDFHPRARAPRHNAKLENPMAAAANPLDQPGTSGFKPSAASAGPIWPEMVQMEKIVAMG
jgi:hypothetical protein